MALIRSFIHKPHASAGYRTEVDCGWTAGPVGDRRILHLETYGSSTRQIPGKISQSIQLDEAAARELVQIIRTAFPGLD